MFNKRKTSLLVLVLLASFAVPSLTVSLRTSDALFAQESASETLKFPRLEPEVVSEEITVRIASSSSMRVINQNLRAEFEAFYQEQKANVIISNEIDDTDAALQAVLEGFIDLAAIGRPVTKAEDEQGLKGVLISREKIAIIVGPNNPFTQAPFPNDLTAREFARIFRGEITSWSQVGGLDAPIQFIDRPENSDIRQTLSQYEVFKEAEFTTAPNTIRVAEDDTAAIVRRLGRYGISYAIASQVIGQENVQVVPMHGVLPDESILPDDKSYPFSQPWGYVYKKDPQGLSPEIKTFLGFATDPVFGQGAVIEAKTTEAAGVAMADIPTGVVAVSQQASLLASAGRDGYLQFRNFKSEPKGEPIKAHVGPITDISISPDGKTIATSGADGVVKLWSPEGEELPGPLSAVHDGPIIAVAFSPDGQTLASGGQDGTVRFWDLQQKEQPPMTISAHAGGVRSLAFSPDGQLIATGGADQTVGLWDLNGQLVVPLMAGHMGAVTEIAFSPDPQTSPNPKISAPQASSDPQDSPEQQSSPELQILAGPKLVSGSEDQTLRLWSVLDGSMGQPIGQPFEVQGPVTSVAFSPDGQTIISGSENAPLRQWNLKGESVGAPFAEESAAATNSISFGPDGQTLISSTANGEPKFWNSLGQATNELPQVDPQGEYSFDDWLESLKNQPPGIWGFGLVGFILLGYITKWLFGDREWKEPKLEEVKPSQKSIDISQTTEDVTDKQESLTPSETPDSKSADFDEADFAEVSSEDFSNISSADFSTASSEDFPIDSSVDSPTVSSEDFSDIPATDFSTISSEDFSNISSADFSTVSSEDFAAVSSEDSTAISSDAADDSLPPPPAAPEKTSVDSTSKLVQAQKSLLEGIKLAKAGRYKEALDQLQLAIEAADVERVKASLSGASLAGATALLASGMARRGSILVKLNRTDEAIGSLDKAAEFEPESITVLARKAKALKDSGRVKEAQICFKQATKLKKENIQDPVRLAEESLLPKKTQFKPNADAPTAPSKGGDVKRKTPPSKPTQPTPFVDKQNQPQRGSDKTPVFPPPPPKLPNNTQPKESSSAVPSNGDSEDIPATVKVAFEGMPSQLSNLDEASLIEDASPKRISANILKIIPASEESRAPVDWPDPPENLESDSADIPSEVQAAFEGIPPNSADVFG